MKSSALILAAITSAFLIGCQSSTPVVINTPEVHKLDYRDTTIANHDWYFEETPQSRKIIVGSAVYARAAGCQIIQRYKIRTNADFTASMNLFKYRAYEMGGSWVVVTHHSEIDSREPGWLHEQQHAEDVFYRAGTDAYHSQFFTTLVGDIYDCPCDTDSCKARH